MKYIYLAILLLITASKGMAQSKEKKDWIDVQFYQVAHKTDTAWVKGDTLDLGSNTILRFIKIGDDIYNIIQHNATIELYKPPTSIFGSGIMGYPNGWR